MPRLVTLLAALLSMASGCGYHVSGHADILPKTVKTIAIPAFGNNTTRYKLTDRMAQSLTREFITRTRYKVVYDLNQADLILQGAVINVLSFPTTVGNGRATGVQISVVLKLDLIERATGKSLYSNPSMDVKDRYEISANQVAYFEESDAALDRLSKNVAQAIVSRILEGF